MSHEPVYLAFPGTRLQKNVLTTKPYHLKLHRYQQELGTQSRRQWGRTETAKPMNQSLSKHQTPITAKQPPLLLLLKR